VTDRPPNCFVTETKRRRLNVAIASAWPVSAISTTSRHSGRSEPGLRKSGRYGWEVQDRRGWPQSQYCACRCAGISTGARRRGATVLRDNVVVRYRKGAQQAWCPTATGRGIWEAGQVRRVMERLK
jgi:hypothetical protein